MTLRLRNIGIATAYASVGVGEVEPEMNTAATAFTDLGLEPPELLVLLGQADVATTYETADFTDIFKVRYPSADSNATIVNWVFSVPYELGRSAHEQPDPGAFRFILHLRLRRAVYAYPGIEEKIVAKLYELLGSHKESSRIHVGLGWSDLIVDGSFIPDTFSELIAFIIKLHGLRITCGPERTTSLPVLQRMLTLFGYYRGTPPPFPNRKHVTFLRVVPGSYDEVKKILDGLGAVRILDGKADFMIVSDQDDIPADWLVKQRQLGDGTYRESLRKVETHLMYFEADQFDNHSAGHTLNIDASDAVLHELDCECCNAADALVAEIDATMHRLTKADPPLLPPEQRYAIDNMLFLLASTLRDTSVCCDTRDAVVACQDGLLRILLEVEFAGAEPDVPPDRRYNAIVSLWEKLDAWHRFTELLLRQRMVGSYEEFLGQSDRSVVHSGGVQKFLYLADQLMIDFANRVQPIDPPKFATIFDSVRTIFSFRTGVVRMPTRKIFSFPHVVADLWHEVAGTLFFLRVAPQLRVMVAELLPKERVHDVLAHVADHYADIVVYLHGFRGDFNKFLASHKHGWTLAYRDVDPAVRQYSVGQFLLRAYLVYEFDRLRAMQRAEDRDAAQRVASDEIAPETVERFSQELAEILEKYVHFDPSDWVRLRRNATAEHFSMIHRQLYEWFVRTEVQPARTSLEAFREGKIVELSDADDLNALFGDLACWLIDNPSDENAFRTMAAVGKSAAIEYHRRQARRPRREHSADSRADGQRET